MVRDKPADLAGLMSFFRALTADTAGRRKYPEALHMFVQGLTAPTFVVNAITIATYKKYALVSLIHSGKAALVTLQHCEYV